jgi:hypothetical protein
MLSPVLGFRLVRAFVLFGFKRSKAAHLSIAPDTCSNISVVNPFDFCFRLASRGRRTVTGSGQRFGAPAIER